MYTFSFPYLAGFAFTLYFVLKAIYRLFLSPLRSVPGPWYTAISSLWFIVHTLRCHQCKVIDELFQKYGPVVRVAPNKVYFLDVQTMKDIYGASAKLSKSSFYKGFQIFDGIDFSITKLDHSVHAISKRNYSPHYTSANLTLFQPEIHEFTVRLVDYLRVLDTGSSCDALSMFSHLLIDVNCFHLFNSRVKSLQNWEASLHTNDLNTVDPIKTAIHDYPKRLTLKNVLPYWSWLMVNQFSKGRLRQLCGTNEILSKFVDTEVKRSFREIQSKSVDPESKDRMSLITRLLLTHNPVSEADFKVIVSEGTGNLVASVETTATTLSYIFWELSRRKDILNRLHEELDANIPDPNIVPDIQVLNDLPYLSAVVKEGLRIYTAVPGPLERVVPSKDSPNGAFSLLGHVLPVGTIIATQAWSSHRCADVFENPNKFEPERWLRDSSSNSDEASSQSKMQSHMMPFGYGTRICGGQVMAQMMLRIVVAMLARNFDIAAPLETNEKSMAVLDSFGIFPASMKCKLIFLPRSK